MVWLWCNNSDNFNNIVGNKYNINEHSAFYQGYLVEPANVLTQLYESYNFVRVRQLHLYLDVVALLELYFPTVLWQNLYLYGILSGFIGTVQAKNAAISIPHELALYIIAL